MSIIKWFCAKIKQLLCCKKDSKEPIHKIINQKDIKIGIHSPRIQELIGKNGEIIWVVRVGGQLKFYRLKKKLDSQQSSPDKTV